MHSKKIILICEFFLLLFLFVDSKTNQRLTNQIDDIQNQMNRLENSDYRKIYFSESQTFMAQKSHQDTVQTAQREVSEQINQPWYVILAIIGGGAILIVLLIVLYKTLLSKYCCDQNWYYAPQWIEMIPQQLSHEFYSDYLRFLDADDLCSICLSGKCDTITSCRHIFHLQCFLQWLKTDKKCPNCKKEEFSAKYFCWQCKKKYCSLDDLDMIDKCSSYLKEFPKCDVCYAQQLKEQQSKKNVVGIMQPPGEINNFACMPPQQQIKKQRFNSQSQENIGAYLQSQ